MSQSNETVADFGGEERAPTTRKAARAAREAVEGTAARAEKLEAGLRTRADRAGENLRRSGEAVERRFEDSVADAETFVRQRPFVAAGIAFAAGALVSALLRRG